MRGILGSCQVSVPMGLKSENLKLEETCKDESDYLLLAILPKTKSYY